MRSKKYIVSEPMIYNMVERYLNIKLRGSVHGTNLCMTTGIKPESKNSEQQRSNSPNMSNFIINLQSNWDETMENILDTLQRQTDVNETITETFGEWLGDRIDIGELTENEIYEVMSHYEK